MIPMINAILAILGLIICTVFLLSDKFNTTLRETISQLGLWVAVWLFFLMTSLPDSQFHPSWASTIARSMVLALNVWHFKDLIITRCKKHKWKRDNYEI